MPPRRGPRHRRQPPPGRQTRRAAGRRPVDRAGHRRRHRPAAADELPLGRTEFVRADIRNPLIAKVIAHGGGRHRRAHERHRDAAGRRRPHVDEGDQRHRHHAAARRLPEGAASMRKLVVQVVDGGLRLVRRATRRCSPRTMEPRALPRSGYAKDAVEVEGYVRGFAPPPAGRHGRRAAVHQLHRPGDRQPADALPALPVVPTVLGFDPRVQLLHEDDGSRCCGGRRSRTTRARSTSAATGCCCCPRRSAGSAGSPVPVPAPAVQRRSARLVRRAGLVGLLPGADALPRATAGSSTPTGCATELG